MKECEDGEVQLHSFVVSAVVGGGVSTSSPSVLLTPEEKTSVIVE